MSKWILRICMLIVYPVLFLNSSWIAIAEDCQDCDKSAPTPAGNAEYTCEWNCDSSINTEPLEFDDESTEDTIDAGGSITVSVTGGVPPYTFSTSSNGYTFDGGVQTLATDSTSVTLSCASGTCGTDYDVYATLTVTDCCEDQETIVIRNSSGEWVEVGRRAGNICSDHDYENYLTKPAVDYITGYQKWHFIFHPYCFDRYNGCQTATWTEVTSGSPVDPWCDSREAYEEYSTARCHSAYWGFSNGYTYYIWGCP